ncbi:hypothetical protein [[Clostridium] colinum]|uniref:hypothetical protein n=1 Tax=[Clostridium] colinum TaxID=36835 RepID=UPI0020243700|nr:hypothetical protein [[Clostridium] colinum]
MYPYFSKKDETIEKKDILENDLDDKIEEKLENDFRTHIIESIGEAIKEQDENSRYYEKLYNIVKDEKDKNTLRQIHLNETKFKNIFMKLYKMLTGKDFELREDYEEIDLDDNISEEFYDSIEDQLENIEFYRILMSAFSDLPIRDMIYEIIVGKQKNAQLLSNLYNKYKK